MKTWELFMAPVTEEAPEVVEYYFIEQQVHHNSDWQSIYSGGPSALVNEIDDWLDEEDEDSGSPLGAADVPYFVWTLEQAQDKLAALLENKKRMATHRKPVMLRVLLKPGEELDRVQAQIERYQKTVAEGKIPVPEYPKFRIVKHMVQASKSVVYEEGEANGAAPTE